MPGAGLSHSNVVDKYVVFEPVLGSIMLLAAGLIFT